MRRLCATLALATAAAVAAAPPAGARASYGVAGLQVALYRYGTYAGPIDGVVGPMTRTAIRDFQRSARLEPDGVAGKQTRDALGRFGRPLFGARTMKRGMVGFDVSVLQFLLAKRGLPPQRLNSNFGPVTEKLVRRFQKKAGVPVDGIVGKATRAALLGPRAKRPKAAKEQRARRHVVRPGETLTAIAEAHRTTVRALAVRNKLDPGDVLPAGATLLVPRAGVVNRATKTSVAAAIDRWSAHYGVDAQLARALAWQESGFQNHVRSSTGAVGVMQVMPATRDFVELFVIGERVPDTSDGNIRVGVAFLAHLLRQFDGNRSLALAAYYQGPASVRRGLLPETRHFVANVLALRGRV